MFYAGTPTVFKMQGGVQPAVNKDWLELASAKEGSQYVVSTTYAGERNYTVFYDTQMMTPLWTAFSRLLQIPLLKLFWICGT